MPDHPIILFPVQSSNIATVGYNANIKTMRIKFKKGTTYDFFDVPAERYNLFMKSESKGKHFFRNIKGKYESKKVGA